MKSLLEDIGGFIRDTVRSHFDKLLLSAIFAGLVTLTIHLIHDAETTAQAAGVAMTGSDFVNWAETQSGTVLGALLTLITGAVAKNALAQTPDKPSRSDEPSSPPAPPQNP